mgnify:CR=1 FL=1
MKQFAILMFYLFQNPFAFGQTTNDQMTFFTYTYNKSIIKNNRVKTLTIQKSFSGENQLSKSVYHFDRNGLLTKMSIIDSKGKLLREYYFLTNSYNDLISRIQKDYEIKKDDTLLYFKSYANDKLIKEAEEIKDSIPKMTKKTTVKKISRFFANVRKKSLPLLKEVLELGRKEIFKRGIKFVLNNIGDWIALIG